MDVKMCNEYTKIEDFLYISGVRTANELEILKRLNIERIISADIYALSEEIKNEFIYLHINCNDHQDEDLLSWFNLCNEFINEGLNRKQCTLVHCVAGVSRSATIIIAHLMQKHKRSFDYICKYVRNKRSIIDPNDGFRKQLQLYEQMNFSINKYNRDYRLIALRYLRFISARDFHYSINSEEISKHIENNCKQFFKKVNNDVDGGGGDTSVVTSNLPDNLNEQINNLIKCRKCRCNLFAEINIISSLKKNKTSIFCKQKKCENEIAIEPIFWMLKTICSSPSGTIDCFNCSTKLGNFNWLSKESKEFCYIFIINLNKVDYNRSTLTI